jgi:hypothetical protein
LKSKQLRTMHSQQTPVHDQKHRNQ